MLEEIGVAIITYAASVRDALTSIKEKRPDVVILDLQLGTESGLIVADRCAEDKIPVIFSTGFGDVILPVTGSSEQLLEKPYSIRDLARAISQLD